MRGQAIVKPLELEHDPSIAAVADNLLEKEDLVSLENG